MELRHLRYFITVAEEENVTRAAARLNVSQPPLSRQIRDLEEELGLRLFERGPRSLTLTAAGAVFLPEARAVLGRAEEAMRVAATLAAHGKSEIRIGYAPSLTIELLPRALRRFQAVGAGARVRLHDMSTAEMLDGLAAGSIDVAMMIRPEGLSSKGIHFRPLRKHAVCLAMHPGHPLATRPRIGLKQVAAERLISYSAGDYPEYHSWLARLFKKHPTAPLIGEEHDSSTSLIASVEAGRGVALVQQGFESLSGPRLLLRPLLPAPPPFIVGVAWSTGAVDGVVRRFLSALLEGDPALETMPKDAAFRVGRT